MVAEERWLWSAVLQSAVLDYLGRRRVLKDQIQHREIDERAQIESAREWLWDDESRECRLPPLDRRRSWIRSRSPPASPDSVGEERSEG